MKNIIENGKYVSVLYRMISKQLSKQMVSLGLSSMEYIYIMLLQHGQIKTLDVLSKEAVVDKAQTTRAVKRLVEKGLVEKKQSSQDKRAFFVSLSTKGENMVEQVTNEIIKLEDTLSFGMTVEEQKLIKKYLVKMIRNLKE